jgi:hypothetical protein
MGARRALDPEMKVRVLPSKPFCSNPEPISLALPPNLWAIEAPTSRAPTGLVILFAPIHKLCL